MLPSAAKEVSWMPIADDESLRDFPDRAIRELLRYPQHLRSLLRRVVPELADGFDCDRVRWLDRELPLDDWRRRASDLLCLIPYRIAAPHPTLSAGRRGRGLGEGELQALVCVLTEHQSKPDPLMPLRTLLYAVLFWEREWKTWHDQPTPRATLRLTPVLPIVFHTGPRMWGSNCTLKDLLGRAVRFSRLCARLATVVLEPGVAGTPSALGLAPMSGYKRWPCPHRKSIAETVCQGI